MTTEDSMLVTAHESRVHGLINFLQRPIPVARYTWVTGDASNDVIIALSFPETIWNQVMWNEKLKGFRYLKADLNFQIQLNGSPFDVGRLWCFWSPFDAERDDRRPFYTRTNTTGYPGVEVDLGNQMTAELTIPYVSPYSHIDQLLGSQPYGIFRVQVLSQFFSQASPSASVTVYCWMSNIDLSIPTDTKTLGSTVPFVGQVNEQMVRSKAGIITNGASIVGEAARMFANVPVIGEVSKPISWVADATKGVASLLGLSKPSSVRDVTTMAQIPGKGFTHSDGLDNSVILGTKPDNEIGNSHAVFGTKEDEMNMSYIVGRPNWIQAFNWQVSTPVLGDPLYTIPIHAGICGTEHVGPTNSSQWTATHMSYVAAMHRFWRGGVSLRFSAVKNQFYSGRLVFVFYPGIRDGQIFNYTTFDVSKCYQWVWDIRRDEDLQLTIPFQSNLQFLRVNMHNNSQQIERESLGSDTITGTLAVYVDNQLRAPPTVPDNIWIHVWVHGAADMTFAVPDMVVFGPLDTPSNLLLPTIATAPFTGQMMEVEDTFDVNHKETGKQNAEGSSLLISRPKDSLVPELMCIGEINNNLRPYTRRMGQVYSFDQLPPTNGITLDPAFFFEGGTTATVSRASAPINYVSRLYAFYRGSVRYKVFVFATTEDTTPPDPSDIWKINRFLGASTSEIVSGSPRNYTVNPNFALSVGFGRMVHLQPVDNNPIFEIQCPYYSNVPIQLISKVYITNLHLRMLYKYFSVLTRGSDTFNIRIWKGAGDDFSFGYLVGAPLIMRSGAL